MLLFQVVFARYGGKTFFLMLFFVYSGMPLVYCLPLNFEGF